MNTCLRSAKKHLEKLSQLIRKAAESRDLIVLHYIAQGMRSIQLEAADLLIGDSDRLKRTQDMQEKTLREKIGDSLFNYLEDVVNSHNAK